MLARVFVALIRLYQRFLSPVIVLLFGRACRFEPSCSQYAASCIEMHGAGKGSLLSIWRLCKCHPFHPGGYDPPPPPASRRESLDRPLHEHRAREDARTTGTPHGP